MAFTIVAQAGPVIQGEKSQMARQCRQSPPASDRRSAVGHSADRRPRFGPAVLGLQPFGHRIFYWQFCHKDNNLKEDMAPEVCLLQQNP
jgi:hypothetical protein